MSKRTVLLTFGGESSEHDVSINSARNIYAAMDDTKYEVELCYIDRSGKWWYLEEWQNVPGSHSSSQLIVAPGTGSFVTLPGSKIIHVDVIFPVLHGKNGEDGTIQGMAAIAHVPVVGPSTVGAAITMDKDVTKHLLRDGDIPVVDWVLWKTSDPTIAYADIMAELGEVVFVKPSNAGSSIGVSKVRNQADFEVATEDASKHDSMILIERAIAGIEVQVSVLGNDHPQISNICEIESATDFHDFKDKYDESSTAKFHIPARLSDEQTKRIKSYALKAYRLTRGRGMARIDFFVVNETSEYLNEINAIPGFTNVSVYPRLWHEAGIPISELVDRLIESALE